MTPKIRSFARAARRSFPESSYGCFGAEQTGSAPFFLRGIAARCANRRATRLCGLRSAPLREVGSMKKSREKRISF